MAPKEYLNRRGALARMGLLAAAGFAGCVSVDPQVAPPAPADPAGPPPAPREFRGAWIASVANIDWPSRPGLGTLAQQEEARGLVRLARSIGLNALILQVRPAGDALYASSLEPWSEYLTGEQGRAPRPYYDPLAFWIEEAHREGIELHAWFNPYRARHPSARGALSDRHLATARPELVKSYGDLRWTDPGRPEAAELALAVILDVVRRYDIDGVHVDDYFYPYPIKAADGRELPFPDDDSYGAYLASGGRLPRADWRRANVDSFIERLYREVRRENDRIRVGVSPFGIGRPDRRPPGIAGFSQYDAIYADVERWLENGWMDYLAPQLYWKSDSAAQPFAPLLDYWQAQNVRGRQVWPGLFTSRIDSSEASWMPEEIAGQIALARQRAAGGHIHFSIAALAQDRRGIAARLRSLYHGPALVPVARASGERPSPPSVRVAFDPADAARVGIAQGEAPWLLAAWARYGNDWRFFVLPRGEGTIPPSENGQRLVELVVSSVDRTGVESARVQVLEVR